MGCGGNEDAVLVGGAKKALFFKGNVKEESVVPFGLDLLDEFEEDLI